MYEKLLSEAEKYLEGHRTKEVPILELWDEMAERAEEHSFDMPENLGDFEMLIEADKRFVFVAVKTEEEIEDDVDIGEEEGEYEVGEDFFEVEKMEKLGFNQDQIVGLKKYERKRPADDDDDDTPSPAHSVNSGNRSTAKHPATHAAKQKTVLPKTKHVKATPKIGKSSRGKK